MKQLLKSKIKNFLPKVRLYIAQRPKLRKIALYLVAKFPNLKLRLTQISSNNYSTYTPVPMHLVDLTPHARQIYADLKAAIDQRQKRVQ
jgi:O-antigen chain-terminating methyltransferase